MKPELVREVSFTELTTDGIMRHPSFEAMRNGKKTFLNLTDETQVREINGHEIKFNNLNKIYWPKEKITKSS